MSVTKQLMDPIDIQSMQWKSMGPINCLVTHILQNTFCVQQKTEIHTGLEQLEGE